MIKDIKDVIGVILILGSTSWLAMAFTIAILHDYYGKFQQVNSVVNCFFPVNLF